MKRKQTIIKTLLTLHDMVSVAATLMVELAANIKDLDKRLKKLEGKKAKR